MDEVAPRHTSRSERLTTPMMYSLVSLHWCFLSSTDRSSATFCEKPQTRRFGFARSRWISYANALCVQAVTYAVPAESQTALSVLQMISDFLSKNARFLKEKLSFFFYETGVLVVTFKLSLLIWESIEILNYFLFNFVIY